MKRIFDLIFSLLFLILLSPLYVIIAISIYIFLGSPVIFKQQRPGLRGKPFYIYKFRTMTNKKGSDGKLLPDDQRIPPFGQFLRKWSLDELPQMLNIIKGDLSLIGPRPLMMEYLSRYNEIQARRHEVRPGITGWAQVNGRNSISWTKKFELDIWYVDNKSFSLDIYIIFLTFLKVIKSDGISEQNHATVSEFLGNEGD